MGHQRENQDIFSVTYDLVSLKLLFYVRYEHASLRFVSQSHSSPSKLHNVALRLHFAFDT